MTVMAKFPNTVTPPVTIPWDGPQLQDAALDKPSCVLASQTSGTLDYSNRHFCTWENEAQKQMFLYLKGEWGTPGEGNWYSCTWEERSLGEESRERNDSCCSKFGATFGRGGRREWECNFSLGLQWHLCLYLELFTSLTEKKKKTPGVCGCPVITGVAWPQPPQTDMVLPLKCSREEK